MWSVATLVASLVVVHAYEWTGCESFPGFGSASDDVVLSGGINSGSFNITTVDFLGSRSCQGGGDLTWGHHGVYSCGDMGEIKFERRGVWITAHTSGGQLFGKVLCPHITLEKGVRMDIALADLPTKCASLTFNNCATFYDTLSSIDSGKLIRRSSAPSCEPNPARSANGPPLSCIGETCKAPCQHTSNPGACGKQCKIDADCASCGMSGKCKGADQVTKICVDAPSSVPEAPQPSTTAVDWPETWAADMFTLTYNDFSDNRKTQIGRFYYDFAHGRQLQDFGKTSLLYITGSEGKTSKFYFIAFGHACFFVETKDPLSQGGIGIPRPNFMKTCADMHDASYVGREQVRGEWADHYTCSVSYDNQTIAFQTWHSLGLASNAFGVPLALSAGDSKPTWQAPRLTTTWYSNVTTGPQAAPASLFVPPKICIPIPQNQIATPLGFHSESLFTVFSNEDMREKAFQSFRGASKVGATNLIV